MIVDTKYDESWKGEYKYMGIGNNSFSDSLTGVGTR